MVWKCDQAAWRDLYLPRVGSAAKQERSIAAEIHQNCVCIFFAEGLVRFAEAQPRSVAGKAAMLPSMVAVLGLRPISDPRWHPLLPM